MKKFLASVAAGAMMLVGASQAMAFFEEGHLVRAVYSAAGTIEVLSDLGDFQSLTPGVTTPTNQNIATAAFSLNDFATGTSYADLRVAYFMYDMEFETDLYQRAWTSGPSTGQVSGNFQMDPGLTGMSGVNIGAGLRTTSEKLVTPNYSSPLYAYSYFQQLNGNGVKIGRYNGFIPSGNGQTGLAELATVGYVDQVLYFYDQTNFEVDYLSQNGRAIMVLRTYADGTTTLNPGSAPPAVPVPASILLLGSGLLGLIGIRRKN